MMIERRFVLRERYGLHLKPSDRISAALRWLACEVTIMTGFSHDTYRRTADAKNLNDLLALGAAYGDTLVVVAHGEDAERAIDEFCSAVAVEAVI